MSLQVDGQMGSVPGPQPLVGDGLVTGPGAFAHREGMNGKAGKFPALPCLQHCKKEMYPDSKKRGQA